MNGSKTGMDLLFRIFRFGVPYWPPLVFAALLITADVGFSLFMAFIQQLLIDRIHMADYERTMLLVKIAAFVTGGAFLVTLMSQWLRSYYQQAIVRDMSLKAFETVNRLPFPLLGNYHSGDLVTRITADVRQMAGVISGITYQIASEALLFAVAFGYLFSVDKSLALLATITALVPLLIGRFFDKRIRELSKRIQAQGSDIRGLLQESLQGIETVKSYEAEETFFRRYIAERRRQSETVLKRNVGVTLMWETIGFSNSAVMIASAVLISFSAIRGNITIGTVLAFMFLIERIQVPVSNFSQLWGSIQQGFAAAERYFALVDSGKPHERPAERPCGGDGLAPALELEDVTLTIAGESGDKRMFQKLNLRIEAGEIVAVIGPSGAGKTTLARLCCGLYPSFQGRIRIFGTSMSDHPEEAGKRIAYVTQTPNLFYGTVMENLSFGNERASEEEIVAAAKLANAHEFIERLEEGYGTIIQERGQSLSAGQRQRLALARAIVKDAPFIVMDEATSSLDPESDRLVQASMSGLLQGRTALVITHRLSTIRHASRILVMNHGAIVEEGTHEQLMSLNGLYAKWVELQNGEESVNEMKEGEVYV